MIRGGRLDPHLRGGDVDIGLLLYLPALVNQPHIFDTWRLFRFGKSVA